MLHVVTPETFAQEVLEAPTAVVKFGAPWCGPCKQLAPIFEKMAAERPDVKFAEINVDDAISLASQHGVMSVPTTLKFEGGKVVKRLVGLQPKEAMEAILFG